MKESGGAQAGVRKSVQKSIDDVDRHALDIPGEHFIFNIFEKILVGFVFLAHKLANFGEFVKG